MDLQGCRHLFNETLPSVQEIASFQVAISLWYNFLFDENFNEDEDELGDALNEKYREKVEKSLESFASPHLILDLIKESLLKVENELDSWINYTKYETLHCDQIIVFRHHLKCCVWLNGKIDYRQTAQKMLFLDDLSRTEKFGIICKFCLRNEIKNLTPDSELENFFNEVYFQSNPLTFYWICYLKNELDRLVLITANSGSLEGFMITQDEVDNWFAIEYFWDYLSEQDQITKAIELLQKWPVLKFQKRVLSKLNDFQLREVFSAIPVEIMVNFWARLAEPETALAIWTRIKTSISGEQFSTLVDEILAVKNYSEENIPLTIRVWESADDLHKIYLLEQKKEIIIKYYFRVPTFCSQHHSLKFLYAVLSYSSPSYRKQIILDHGDHLVVNDHFFEADKIIELCLPNDDEIIKLKNRVIKSSVVKEHCDRLFQNGNFEYLNKFVEFYSPDKSAMKEYQKLMLESNEIDTIFIFSPGRWTELEKLVDDVYSDTELAKNVKQRLILASGMKCLYDWTNIDLLRQMIKITDEFLNDEDMVKLKSTLVGRFRSVLMGGYYWKSWDETYWKEFADWCLSSEEKIKEFKSSIPIDEVFDEIMQVMMLQYIYEDEFVVDMLSVMDNFLKWYLEDLEEVKKYKLARIFKFRDLEIIEASIARREEQYTRTLLVWFLGNDEEQIQKFKSEFSDEKVSKMI